MLSPNTVRTLNRLIYPVIYEPDPLGKVDWVVATVVNRPNAPKDECVRAISEALSLNGWLEQVASRGNHSEVVLKQFLNAIGKRLVA